MKATLSLLIKFATRGPAGKAARHLITFLAGWIPSVALMQGHGEIDPASIASVLTGLGMLAVVSLWSVATKRTLGPDQRSTLRLVIEAVVGHLVPVLSGAMAARGYSGAQDDAAAASEWIALGALNYLRSLLQRPDAKRDDDGDDSTLTGRDLRFDLLFLALLCPAALALSSCAAVPGEDWVVRACIEVPVGKWFGPGSGVVTPEK